MTERVAGTPGRGGEAGRDPIRPVGTLRSRGLMGIGLVCGLAWAASLRGWMIQIAGPSSTFSWLGTFGLILLPGAIVGGLLGWAEGLRRDHQLGGRRRRWLAASPALLALAVADPMTFEALITTGRGGGAIGVALIGLAGGFGLAGRHSRWPAALAGLAAAVMAVGLLLVPVAGDPITSPRGAWAAVHVTSLLIVLCLACSIPHRAAT